MIQKKLLRLVKEDQRYIGLQVLCQWISLLMQIVFAFSLSSLFVEILRGKKIGKGEGIYLALMVMALLMRKVAAKGQAFCSYKASANVKRVLRDKIYDKVLRLGMSYQEKISTSVLIQMSGEGVEQLETYYGQYLPQLFYSLLAPLTLFFVLVWVNIPAAVVLLICVPLIPLSIVAVQKIAGRLLKKYWGQYTQMGDCFLENLQGMTTLKIYQAEDKKGQQMDVEAERFRKSTMQVLKMQLNSISVMDLVAYGGTFVGIVTIVLQYQKNQVSLAGALATIFLAAEFFIPLRLLGSFFHVAMNGMAASDKIFAFLEMDEPVKKEETIDTTYAYLLQAQDVSFAYKKGQKVLNHITFELPPKKMVAVVGKSGCGKSTLAGILSGKNQGYDGHIVLGNTKLNQIQEANLLQYCTTVSSDCYLFTGTVAENLQMAKKDVTKEEMISVLKKANIWAFLEKKDGLFTKIQERGSNLSGGQRQRIAIARALLLDSPMYIFDEATSSIDRESEELVMETIMNMRLEKSILLISHRLQNVVTADEILLMEDGFIIEKGTHEELIAQQGAYFNLWEKQKVLENYGRRK